MKMSPMLDFGAQLPHRIIAMSDLHQIRIMKLNMSTRMKMDILCTVYSGWGESVFRKSGMTDRSSFREWQALSDSLIDFQNFLSLRERST